VRTITFPPISSRRIRFGEPTSPTPGRNGRGLEGEPVLDDRLRRLVDDAVLRRPSALEGEIEFTERKPDADDIWLEHAQRGLEKLLSRLVAVEDHDRAGLHLDAV